VDETDRAAVGFRRVVRTLFGIEVMFGTGESRSIRETSSAVEELGLATNSEQDGSQSTDARTRRSRRFVGVSDGDGTISNNMNRDDQTQLANDQVAFTRLAWLRSARRDYAAKLTTTTTRIRVRRAGGWRRSSLRHREKAMRLAIGGWSPGGNE
jgi:hypothetical protein